MKEKRRAAVRIVLTILTAAAVAAIFYNSSRSAVESTEQSSPLTDWVNSLLAVLPIPFSVTEVFIRKAAHFSEYAVLGTLLTAAVHLYTCKRRKTLWISLALGAFVAVCDELIQLFPAGRSCEVRDMLIDFCGIVFAAFIVVLLIYLFEKRRLRNVKEG